MKECEIAKAVSWEREEQKERMDGKERQAHGEKSECAASTSDKTEKDALPTPIHEPLALSAAVIGRAGREVKQPFLMRF